MSKQKHKHTDQHGLHAANPTLPPITNPHFDATAIVPPQDTLVPPVDPLAALPPDAVVSVPEAKPIAGAAMISEETPNLDDWARAIERERERITQEIWAELSRGAPVCPASATIGTFQNVARVAVGTLVYQVVPPTKEWNRWRLNTGRLSQLPNGGFVVAYLDPFTLPQMCIRPHEWYATPEHALAKHVEQLKKQHEKEMAELTAILPKQ